MAFEIPTKEEIKEIFREEFAAFAATFVYPQTEKQPFDDADDIGGIEMAKEITGKEISTIYTMCSKRQIPHSKRGGDLYFSRRELLKWISDGRRKTVAELTNSVNNQKGNKNKYEQSTI